ncbi:patatin-like phospholipase family protein [Ancylobacter terrae]|uniref:patatin-like phospholipase family protein n=1 Tax=Ancylobacter sp. sgz301288 TaxID=3342077 RepID=UPI00385C07B9
MAQFLPTCSRRLLRLAGALLVGAALAACAGSMPRTPYTQNDSTLGAPMGIPDVRIWADGSLAELAPVLARFRAERAKVHFDHYSILAISGGGSDGAYGAGLLNGWSTTGKRPEFSVVTGVSTGALTSPFAFLGPAYDAKLKDVYTTTDTNDILGGAPVLGLVSGDGAFNTGPLQQMVAKYCDAQMLAEIAAQHRAGRRLFVLTTDLDAQRPVMWDMGAIANSGNPRALDLFRRVLVASASIPVAFQPMMIEVIRDNFSFKEMHVDGGTTMQVLTVPTKIAAVGGGEVAKAKTRSFYVLLNKKFEPSFDVTKASTFAIAARSFDTLMKSATFGTVYDTYTYAMRYKYKFQLGFIPSSFALKSKSPFDKPYMNALFQVGYEAGLRGGDWYDIPPGLER